MSAENAGLANTTRAAVASRSDFIGGIPCTQNERIRTPYHQKVVTLVTGTTQPARFPQPLACFGGIFYGYYASGEIEKRESARIIKGFLKGKNSAPRPRAPGRVLLQYHKREKDSDTSGRRPLGQENPGL